MDDDEENGAKTWYCQVSIPKKLCNLYSRRVQKERTILKYGHCGYRPVPRSVGQSQMPLQKDSSVLHLFVHI